MSGTSPMSPEEGGHQCDRSNVLAATLGSIKSAVEQAVESRRGREGEDGNGRRVDNDEGWRSERRRKKCNCPNILTRGSIATI